MPSLLNDDMLLKDLADSPVLVPRQWPSLDKENLIPNSALIAFVMGLTLDPTLNVFLVNRMFDQLVDLDDDRLVHFVADHDSNPGFPVTTLSRHLFPRQSLLALLLSKNRIDPGNVSADLGNPGAILQVTGMQLKSQIEQLLMKLLSFLLQLNDTKIDNFFSLHEQSPP